jgi:polar amino acid transport system permease protein
MDYIFQFNEVFRDWPLLAAGVAFTIIFSTLAMIVGSAVGMLGALARTARSSALRRCAAIYVESFRNTPLLVQLLVLYFALPSLGVRLPINIAAGAALILNNGAYTTEIFRAGIESIHRSQRDAAAALGMSSAETFWHVVLIPSLSNVYPALTSQFILLMLGSSIISVIGAEELTSYANLIQAQNFRSLEVYIISAGVYIALAIAYKIIFVICGRLLFPFRPRGFVLSFGRAR